MPACETPAAYGAAPANGGLLRACLRTLVIGPFAVLPAAAGPLVAVDVGHSLNKPGAMAASGRAEFFFNRDLARDTVEALDGLGLSTRLIGEQGDIERLPERAERAAGSDLFLSIHHDSVQERYLPEAGRFAGYSLFVSRKNVDPEASLECATRVADAFLARGMRPTLHHAEPIPGENRPLADRERGIYWFDDLVVLKRAAMPALLVEAGVIANPAEAERLASEAARRGIAAGIAEGVAGCLARGQTGGTLRR